MNTYQHHPTMLLAPFINVRNIADRAGVPFRELTDKVMGMIESMHALGDDPDWYGVTLEEFCDYNFEDLRYVASVIPEIDERGIRELGKLRFVGHGDCPDCGGEMKVDDGVYHRCQIDYDSEPEESVAWESKYCPLCGYRESNEPYHDR